MSIRRLSRPLSIALAVALSGVPMLHAQGAAAATPTGDAACVAASGPDAGPATADSASRAARAATNAGAAAHGAGDRPDIHLFASVTADEVRFTRQPRICVKLRGDVQLDSVHVVGRRNITSPVVAGTSYRNVYVAVEIMGRLNAECIAARITGQGAGATRGLDCASADVRTGGAPPASGTPP